VRPVVPSGIGTPALTRSCQSRIVMEPQVRYRIVALSRPPTKFVTCP